MRVGFDISQMAHSSGVAVYTQNLAEQLSKSIDCQMVFFYSSLRKPYPGSLPNVISYPIPPSFLDVIFNKWRFIPIEWLLGQIDIFHSSDWTQPKTSAKKVTTYHDVIPIKFPQWSHPKIVDVHKRRLKLVEQEIDQVIAVSEATKRDLLEVSKIPEVRITVIYEAVGAQFRPQPKAKVEHFKKKMKLPDEFVLAIGGVGERRNLKRVREATKGYHLVVTGQDVSWLPYEQLPLLYSSSKVLLYPSFYEGFGLPILEAFSCGVPVVTSNVSSMPEVGGRAALYVNPQNVLDIRKRLRLVMEDKDLRKELIEKGFAQAQKFSWEKCAEETAKVYKKLVQ